MGANGFYLGSSPPQSTGLKISFARHAIVEILRDEQNKKGSQGHCQGLGPSQVAQTVLCFEFRELVWRVLVDTNQKGCYTHLSVVSL